MIIVPVNEDIVGQLLATVYTMQLMNISTCNVGWKVDTT